MVVSRLRQWWGSRRLLHFAAGLTLVAVTAGAGGGVAAVGPVGLFNDAIPTAASVPASPAIQGVAGRSAESAATVAISRDHVDAAPFGVSIEHLAPDAAPQRTARDDTLPLRGVAYAPSGLRAPPLHLA